MNKRVFIVHGWGGSPKEGWFPWFKSELEKERIVVHCAFSGTGFTSSNVMTLVEQIAQEVKERMNTGDSGHDWFHVERVWKNAKRIAREEKVDLELVELAALLHDIADWKFHEGDETVGPKMAREFLEKHGASEKMITSVCEIIATISFKGIGVVTPMKTKEGEVVQDADRLDAIGAIGIARTFSYGGYKNRSMYNPEEPPVLYQDKESYKSNTGTTINHFYEKLLHLKDRMNTQTAKRLAEERHIFMEKYLNQFYKEWNSDV